MATKTDFVDFYQQLGLKPNCSMAELKTAYRRRIAELHPDRQPARAAGTEAMARLQELIQLYGEAVAFERRFGRLPGTQHTARVAVGVPPRRRVAAAPPIAAGGAGRSARWLAVLGTIAALGLAWYLLEPADEREIASAPVPRSADGSPTVAPAEPSQPAATPAAAAPRHLDLGMDATMVEALEGHPLLRTSRRWDYGPSWIEFDDDKVSDWYSSQLRPLKVASQRPLPRPANAR